MHIENYFQKFARDDDFFRARNRARRCIAEENCDFVVITFHSGIAPTHIIRDDHVTVLRDQFSLRVDGEIMRLRGEADDEVRPIPAGQRSENVARCC